MNGNSTLQIVGPVVLHLAYGINFNGAGVSGAADQSFTIEIASGDLTLNGSVTLNASVVVPSGRVTINGSAKLNGRVVADNLTLNGNGQLNDPGL
jgi:formylmethanofuran dehydrogenase subunit C